MVSEFQNTIVPRIEVVVEHIARENDIFTGLGTLACTFAVL
jgi:hypothetical protein